MLQLNLPIAQPPEQGLNLVGLVINCLYEREWCTPSEIQRAIYNRTNEWHSDSSITARIRDARKECYGGHIVEKRKREGSRAWEYRLLA